MAKHELFHVSNTIEEIVDFHLLTHFGTLKASMDRSASIQRRGVDDPVLYKVTVTMENPLRIKDLFETNHSWLKLVDYLFYNEKVLTADERGQVFDAAAPSGTNTEMGNNALCSLLKAKGYDGLVYTNLHEDPGSESFIMTDPRTVESLARVQLSQIYDFEWPSEDAFRP